MHSSHRTFFVQLSSLSLVCILGCTSKGDPGGPSTSTVTTSESSGSTSSTSGVTSNTSSNDSANVPTTNDGISGNITGESESSSCGGTCGESETQEENPFPDMGTRISECNPQSQDCPSGQKCAPYTKGSLWESAHCVPVPEQPAKVGEPCQIDFDVFGGLDNCDIGSFCWDADGTNMLVCAPMCSGSLDYLDLHCPPGYFCDYFSEFVTICEEPSCNPLLQDCPNPDDVCVPNLSLDDDWCLEDVSGEGGKTHDPCEINNACDKGLTCIPSVFAAVECNQDFWGCCQPFCEIGAGTCSGAGQECQQYFPFYDGGLCYLP